MRFGRKYQPASERRSLAMIDVDADAVVSGFIDACPHYVAANSRPVVPRRPAWVHTHTRSKQ